MPIKSYLVYPVSGRLDELTAALRQLSGCDVIPAVNRDLLVLVTDMPDEGAEEALEVELASVPALQALALVAGVGDEAIESSRLHTTGGRP